MTQCINGINTYYYENYSNISQITSLNTRITTDETNISNNTTSIISLNSRITTDKTNINTIIQYQQQMI